MERESLSRRTWGPASERWGHLLGSRVMWRTSRGGEGASWRRSFPSFPWEASLEAFPEGRLGRSSPWSHPGPLNAHGYWDTAVLPWQRWLLVSGAASLCCLGQGFSLSVRACVTLPLQSIRCCLYKASCQFRVQKVFLKTYVSLVVNKYEHVSW